MKHSFVVALTGILFFITGAYGTPLYAQTSEGLEIKPAVIEDKVDPGEEYSFTLTVKNIADKEKTFYFVGQDIKGLNEEGLPVFAEDNEPTGYELSSWLVFPSDSVTLGAGESRSIPFSIRVPAGAAPGAHFGGVFLDNQPDRLRTTGSSIGVRVGSVINLRIAGEVNEEARIREFSTGSFFYNAPPVDFNTRVENIGNVLLRPYGVIEITNMLGKKVDTITVNDSAASVFPGSERDYETVWEHDGFTFGKYEATIGLIYGDDIERTISAKTSFWILPAKPILITLGVFASIVFLMSLFTKLYINRRLREMGVSSTSQASSARQARRSASRMMVLTIAVFLFVTVSIVILFLMFA